MAIRIEVGPRPELLDARGKRFLERIRGDVGVEIDTVRILDVYTIDARLDAGQAEQCRSELFTDPVTQVSTAGRPLADAFDWAVEIGYLPGVTDNVGHTSREAVEDLLGIRFEPGDAVYYSEQVLLGGEIDEAEVRRVAELRFNPLINRLAVKDRASFDRDGGMGVEIPKVTLPVNDRVDTIDLEQGDEELARLGKLGILDHVEEGREIRRGPLALDLDCLHVIRDYFRKAARNPTDVELEAIAQTWSEHCKHTIFAAKLDEIDSLYVSHIKKATEEVRKNLGDDDWCLSVFSDNSGVVRFNDDWSICYKVETHNSPSALDPYGGAITGIVGVNRDPLGTGLGARLIANVYGFCFGDPNYAGELMYKQAGGRDPILHPKIIFEGVREGVEHGGNKSGIPTAWGWLVFDERYMGKPLVFVGTVGLIPAMSNGRPGHSKEARAGDLIVMAGGRVGKDGIHGATFSSEQMHSGSPAGAVQIGDPITQKKMGDAQQEIQALDLYSSVTDNGAGGLSCSVAEMARECGGCRVDLDRIPIKYQGMAPYETWISESQERMTYAVPPASIDRFLEIMERRGVEASVIGEFTDSGRCTVELHGHTIMDLEMDFLHDGMPQRRLVSTYHAPEHKEPDFQAPGDLAPVLNRMLGRLNVCSKEYVVRQFDHEVQGGSVIKPLVGIRQDVHSDAVVTRPLLDSDEGIALSTALYPSYGDIDPYQMAACAIDTAIRNLVVVGANPDRIALLDNFCWCSSDEPERLGQLKRTTRACYDGALAFTAPFISGKDSMYNDFKGFDGESRPTKISVPPTLLISSIGKVEDVRKCVTLDAKRAGDLVCIIGETREELGGSEYYAMIGEELSGARYIGNRVPVVEAAEMADRYRALGRALDKEFAASCASIGLGGLGTALAKTAIAGDLGLDVDLTCVPLDGDVGRDDFILFSETMGRVLITVDEASIDAFARIMEGHNFAVIGHVTDERLLRIRGDKGEEVVLTRVDDLRGAYTKTLDW